MSDIRKVTGRQIAAARALVGLDQAQLAQLADISASDLQNVEEGKDTGDRFGIVIAALQQAGIKFIDDDQTSAAGGPGVRLALSPDPEVATAETVQYPEHLQPDAPTGAGG